VHGLEKLLVQFYADRTRVKHLVEASAEDYSALDTEQLIARYTKNRDLVHYIVLYDQFGFLGEYYWNGKMERILTQRCGLVKDSASYNEALFALIKPREISTTLEEKRTVLKEAIAVQEGKQDVQAAAEKLAASFGWMPVFAYGEPWASGHYVKELADLGKTDPAALARNYRELEQ
jgi:hypothetical protein